MLCSSSQITSDHCNQFCKWHLFCIFQILTPDTFPVAEAVTQGNLVTTQTHTFNGSFPGLPRWASTTKVKPIWILLKQATVSGSGIHWAICKSAPSSRQITTPAPHHWVFYRPDALPAAQPTVSKHLVTSNVQYIYLLICSKTVRVEIAVSQRHYSQHEKLRRWSDEAATVVWRHSKSSWQQCMQLWDEKKNPKNNSIHFYNNAT